MFLRYLSAEILKLRRSLALLLCVTAPTLVVGQEADPLHPIALARELLDALDVLGRQVRAQAYRDPAVVLQLHDERVLGVELLGLSGGCVRHQNSDREG